QQRFHTWQNFLLLNAKFGRCRRAALPGRPITSNFRDASLLSWQRSGWINRLAHPATRWVHRVDAGNQAEPSAVGHDGGMHAPEAGTVEPRSSCRSVIMAAETGAAKIRSSGMRMHHSARLVGGDGEIVVASPTVAIHAITRCVYVW
ncbi:hypothetical protein, partial [Rhodanobacter denitrificans]|uniref:hypothetical protein n=1 Tax=Rhodanobacter denitrificans TaxID=666685 RepID=UPI001CB8B61A